MNKKNIISLVNLAVSLALVFIFIIPLWSLIRVGQTEIVQKRQEIVNIEDLLDKTQQFKEEYQQIEGESKRSFLTLPKEEDIPFLLVQFETAAISSGLLLESINFGQIIRKSEENQLAFRSLPVGIRINGSYDAFKKYLVALENNIYSMDISSIKFINPRGKAIPSFDIFEYNLSINVYYQ
jgi:Tfp pilus assembly protein PilO